MERKRQQIVVEVANKNDISGIINVEELTWVSSYPNSEIGITVDDVRARFNSEFKEKRAVDILAEMASKKHTYRLVMFNGKIVAYSHFLKEESFGDLVELYVLPEYQGKGIGGALLRNGLSWFESEKPVRLEVATYNPAIEIYEHYGFKKLLNLKQEEDENWNVLPSKTRIPIIFMEKSLAKT